MQSDLGRLLRGVARELRAARLHKRGLRRWLLIALAALVVLQVKAQAPGFEPYYLPLLGVLLALGMGLSYLAARADQLDYAEAARVVEEAFPDLKQALRTAAEQRPAEAGKFNFLQMRVITSALKHANVNNWRRQPRNRARWVFAAHALVLAAALALTLGPALLRLANQDFPMPKITLPHYGVTVTPGNKEVERGAIVVVAARFDGRIPHDAQVIWRAPDGKTGTAAMAKSLSDPVFAYTLPVVNNDTTYSINYLGRTTDQFTLKVFDQPALAKADATLNYPDYTGLATKTIENTRRVSAVTGTKLDYALTMNKPMKEVTLTDEEGNAVPVTAVDASRTKFALNTTIEKTQRLTMHLIDNDGRPNPAPTTLSITATENRRPTVRVTFPVRDQRVSPIEEVHITATAQDQFGLLDYGLAYSVGTGDPQYVSLRQAGAPKSPQASFSDVLKLEPKNVEPGSLVTWYAWADDYGPDGKVRRTTSDLAFAEVRPFETVFQEDDTAGNQAQQRQQPQQQGGQQQSGNPVQDLLQLQRQISVAIWNMKQEDKPNDTFKEDIKTLMDSQNDAISQLADAAQGATSTMQQAAAADAAKFMKQAEDNLTTAKEETALGPLTEAWSGAQGAYQSLLRMQDRNFRVTQTRGQSGQRSQNPMQDQLDQLQFRQQQNRYQSENQAQDPTTDQQRNQMEAQSRLSDLARRQQDLNQRLQELQTALAAAQDQQQRDEIQRELQRLQDEQRSMLDELDQARQNLDQMQAGQQTDQARSQLDQARENMRQATDQLAQNQVSQALASGTRADQSLQQTEQNLKRDTANRFSQQMESARQQARDLSTAQQNNAQQLNQLAQNSAQTLDDSAQRQALAQSYAQEAQSLNQLMDQLRQITVDSEDAEPGLHQQLYDLLRQQSQTTTTDNLNNSAQLLRNGLTSQAQPLQNSTAQNLDRLRQGVERAAQSVLGDDTAAMRFAQNELNDLTQQLMRDQQAAANSEQFRDAGQQPPTPGQNGQQNGGNDNQTAAGQNQPGGQNGQRGANGQGQNGDQTSDQFAQNGLGGQPGQPGQDAQGQGQQGQPGQGQGAQGQQGQGQGRGQGQQGQPGQGQGQGQPGARGQGQGQRGQGQGARGQGGQLAQGGRQGGNQLGGSPGSQGGGQRGQGQGGQANGQDGNSPADAGNSGQLAQNDNAVDQPFDAQPGNGGQQGGRGARGGGQRGGQGRAGGLAQNPSGNRQGGGGANGGNFYAGGEVAGANFGGADMTAGNYLAGNLTGNATGPITGANFADWANRLRIVQNLLDDPQQRQQVANALSQAEDLRRNYLRHSMLPQWNVEMSNVVTPLTQVTTALHQQLLRAEQPDSLQPVDQDPVPEKFANSVKSYYEALGN